MNKIYIKKRINKETKKADDNIICTVGNKSKQSAQSIKKRRRRQGGRVTNDIEWEEYRPAKNNFNTNTSWEEEWATSFDEEAGYNTLRSAPGESREDKKLHYYLEMIRRQESAEQRKIEKKQAKCKNQSKDDNKIWKFKDELEHDEPIQIDLVNGFDFELDTLAQNIHKALQLSIIEKGKGKPCSDIRQAYEGDNMSWHQSDNNSESTLDRLRTPPQTQSKSSSIVLANDEALFANMRISNLSDYELFKIEKPAGFTSDCNASFQTQATIMNDTLSKSSLKDSFWESILNYTRKIQNAPIYVKPNNLECKVDPQNIASKSIQNKSTLLPSNDKNCKSILLEIRQCKSGDYSSPKLCDVIISNNSPRSKPVFLVTRSKLALKSRISRLAYSTSTTVSHLDVGVKGKKSNTKQSETNAAVLLVI